MPKKKRKTKQNKYKEKKLESSIKKRKDQRGMKEAVRCLMSCIIPCGRLDAVHIVHPSGRFEEIGGAVTAAEVMQAYPNHVLRALTSAASCDGVASPTVAVTLPPHAELARGEFYFLTPVSPSAEKAAAVQPAAAAARKRSRSSRKKEEGGGGDDQVVPERQRSRRRGRVGAWRPHLESISEVVVSND